jgi:hypothetical protein
MLSVVSLPSRYLSCQVVILLFSLPHNPSFLSPSLSLYLDKVDVSNSLLLFTLIDLRSKN